MNEPTIEDLFARYVARGDVDALGDVFDRAAPDLLRVALHLVGRPEDADDLLQSTFLTALEKRARWERSRPLLPWLIGILEKHGQDLRRKRAQRRDDVPREVREETTPDASAAFRETSEVFERALQEVPDTYRSALLAYFRDGRKAVEIADELGVAPGTVRMRVHRGLELLKRALPAGAAIGVALSAGTARGLGVVRAEVLRRGVELAPAGLSGGATLAAWTGSLAMKGLAAAAALVLAFVLWQGLQPGEGGAAEARGVVAEKAQQASSAPAGATKLATPSRESDDAARRAATSASATNGALDARWQQALIGFSGRVVDEHGAPLGGIDVELAEVDVRRFVAPLTALFEAPRKLELVVDRARTDSDGHFRVRGARRGCTQALFLDRGGARGTLRLVDRAPQPGATDELGDVVAGERGRVRGRVLRADGAPLASARVCALPDLIPGRTLETLAPLVEQTPFRASAIAFVRRGSPAVELVPAPAALRSLLESLPFPTIFTAADGSFEVARSAGVETWLIVDASGSAAKLVPIAAAQTDAGSIRLAIASALRGRVLDDSGAPIAGAQVRAAVDDVTSKSSESLRLFHGSAATDGDGRFSVEGLASSAPLCIAVQRAGASSWQLSRANSNTGDVEVRLARGATWTLRVRDEQGRAIAGARAELSSNALEWQALLGGTLPLETATCDAEGRARWSGLPRGRYAARVSSPELGSALARATVADLDVETELVLHPVRTLAVLVVDGKTREAIAHANVRWIDGVGTTVASGKTDAAGGVRLPRAFIDLGNAAHAQRAERNSIEVDHPGFARATIELARPDAESATVALDTGGVIEARVRRMGKPARGSLCLRNPGDGTLLLAHADAQGLARVTHVGPGTWSFVASTSLARVERLFSKTLFASQRGECVVASGETTRFDVELADGPEDSNGDATGAGPASVRGRVRVDSAPAAGLRIGLRAKNEQGWSWDPDIARTDGDGRFEIARCMSGAVVLDFESVDEQGQITFRGARAVELQPDARAELALDFRTTSVVVSVLDSDGKPVNQAQVAAVPIGSPSATFGYGGTTDASGRVRIVVAEDNRFRVTASEEGLGQAVRELELHAGDAPQTLELHLDAGVPCRGVARLDGFVPTERAPRGMNPLSTQRTMLGRLSFVRKGEPSSARFVELAFIDGRAEFEVRGLAPGDYISGCSSGSSFSAPVEFSLGAQGDSSLELRLRASD